MLACIYRLLLLLSKAITIHSLYYSKEKFAWTFLVKNHLRWLLFIIIKSFSIYIKIYNLGKFYESLLIIFLLSQISKFYYLLAKQRNDFPNKSKFFQPKTSCSTIHLKTCYSESRKIISNGFWTVIICFRYFSKNSIITAVKWIFWRVYLWRKPHKFGDIGANNFEL